MRPSECKLYAVTVEFDESHRLEDGNGDFGGWSPIKREKLTFNIVAGSDVCTVEETVAAHALAKTKFRCHNVCTPPRVVSVVETEIHSILEIHQ